MESVLDLCVNTECLTQTPMGAHIGRSGGRPRESAISGRIDIESPPSPKKKGTEHTLLLTISMSEALEEVSYF